MHDAIASENLGLPAVGIMTQQFVSAARLMSRILGAPDYQFVTIEHPISSASTEALGERARQAAAQTIDLLLGRASGLNSQP